MYIWVAAAGTGPRRKMLLPTSHWSELVGQPCVGLTAALRHGSRQLVFLDRRVRGQAPDADLLDLALETLNVGRESFEEDFRGTARMGQIRSTSDFDL